MSDSGFRTGESFGDYVVEAQLGEGGMGFVYRAAGPGGERVALKLLRGELSADQGFRKRFAREAAVAQRVDHPHVVATLDHGELDGRLYLVQQLIGGGSLRERIEGSGPLAVGETVQVCAEVAAGLDAMHHTGLVHRDVKPDNIMLDEDGRAYIADFGLAKDREASTVLTRLGQALGSLDYMAPEQIRGAPDVDGRLDVYALGCVAIECLTGDPPFADRQGMRVMWAHLHDDPPDVGTRDEVPAEVGFAVGRALAKEPEARPATATAFARMLQLAAGEAPPSPWRGAS